MLSLRLLLTAAYGSLLDGARLVSHRSRRIAYLAARV